MSDGCGGDGGLRCTVVQAVAHVALAEIRSDRGRFESGWLADVEVEHHRDHHVQRLAGTVAAKKALLDLARALALPTPRPTELVITREPSGAPRVASWQGTPPPEGLFLSITHSSQNAHALACIEERR